MPTKADKSLPHQIRIEYNGENSNLDLPQYALTVSCNCVYPHRMGRITSIAEAWELFNNPDNHKEQHSE